MTDEDPKSLEDVLKQGKDLLSHIDNERELKAKRIQQKKEEEAEKQRRSKEFVKRSQEIFKDISEVSVLPFYSVINHELLHDRGELFDWTRKELKPHWH